MRQPEEACNGTDRCFHVETPIRDHAEPALRDSGDDSFGLRATLQLARPYALRYERPSSGRRLSEAKSPTALLVLSRDGNGIAMLADGAAGTTRKQAEAKRRRSSWRPTDSRFAAVLPANATVMSGSWPNVYE